jgi:diguanylate cyclase (GGDEF)-like protein
MRRARRSGACVFYVDLDGFKAINDDFDHGVGDDVLRTVGARLAAVKRDDDFLAHLHGDEFVMVAAGVPDDRDAATIAGRLVAAVEAPIHHDRGELRVSASVGWRLVADLTAFDDALRRSDQAMAREKRRRAASGRRAPGRASAPPAAGA